MAELAVWKNPVRLSSHDATRAWMRELANLRSDAAKLWKRVGDASPEGHDLVERALDLLERLRAEAAGLQNKCVQLERALQECRDGSRHFFDSAPIAALITDAHGIVREANPMAASLLGRSIGRLRDELLLHYAEDRDGFSEVVKGLREARLPAEHRVRMRPRERAPFEAAITIALDGHRAEQHYVWFIERAGERAATADGPSEN
jgi:PAS domain-containing protein